MTEREFKIISSAEWRNGENRRNAQQEVALTKAQRAKQDEG